ncbi:MAG: hypothetical protein ACRCR9_01750 [Chitinophagaceae bacterium]
MKLKNIIIVVITFSILGCTKVTQQDASEGTLSPKGAIGMLGFTKDKHENYLILMKQNNLYNNLEMRLSKNNPNGKFITDHIILGADSKDNGQTTAGNPGGSGSGRLSYNPDKEEIAIFSCFTGEGHQYSYYSIVSNNTVNFGQSLPLQGGNTYSHCFDQRTLYHPPTKQFYQLSHGDAYPRAMGMFTANTDNKSTYFGRYIIRPPKASAGYGGNVTHTRIGDIAVFENGTVAATIVTPFYDNNFLDNFLPSGNIPCYAYKNDGDDINLKIWKATIEEKYPKNVILNIIPFKSPAIVKEGSIGITPDGINLSEYQKSSNIAAGIPKIAVSDNQILVAWLTYKNYNYNHAGDLSHTVFCLYDTITKTIVKKDSIGLAKLFHTVSILTDPSNKNKVKWITPNETELIYHELDLTIFRTSGFNDAYTTKSIPLKIPQAKIIKATEQRSSGQFGPLGWYGSNPEIDYIINNDGSIDILWKNLNAVSKMYGKNFYPLMVTSINKSGEFKKVITIEVRAAK